MHLYIKSLGIVALVSGLTFCSTYQLPPNYKEMKSLKGEVLSEIKDTDGNTRVIFKLIEHEGMGQPLQVNEQDYMFGGNSDAPVQVPHIYQVETPAIYCNYLYIFDETGTLTRGNKIQDSCTGK